MIECIDKTGKVYLADFSEADGNGNMVCRVYNSENKSCVDTFRIKAAELGWSSREMIAQKKVYATAY